MSRRVRFLLCVAIALVALPPAAAGAVTFNVTTEADGGGACPGPSCTLRQAVISANAGSGGDVIKVPPGHYTLTLGQLQLSKDVTIEAAGPDATVIDGNAASRVFYIPGTTVKARLTGLAIENGRVMGATSVNAQGGGILNSGILTLENVLVEGNEVGSTDNTALIPSGGGIYNSGTLSVLNSTIEGNEATTLPHTGGIPQGGGVANENGQVEIVDSVISRNITNNKSGIPQGAGFYSGASTAHGAGVSLTRVVMEGNESLAPPGGGIVDGGAGTAFRTDLTIRDTTISGNTAIGGAIAGGAGLEVGREGDFIMERSLVADNVAESGTFTNGAGISITGETTEVQRIVNSTITGNRGTSASGNNGGGIFHYGAIGGVTLDVISSTIAGNVVSGSGAEDKGGNLWDSGTEGSATSLRDSIVAGGVGAPGFENCEGEGVKSGGHNIDSLDQCNFKGPGDKVNTSPLLAPLADNGGPTATLAIGPESPAIDAGADCPPTDQRGVVRPQLAACDIGAFEFVPPAKPAPLPPASPSGKAILSFLTTKVKVGLKSGKGKASARCDNVAGDVCQVSLRLLARAPLPSAKATSSKKARRVRVGAIEGTIEGGKAGKLKVTLRPKGLALLAAQPALKLQVIAKGQSRNRAGQPTPVEKKLTVKAKTRKRAR